MALETKSYVELRTMIAKQSADKVAKSFFSRYTSKRKLARIMNTTAILILALGIVLLASVAALGIWWWVTKTGSASKSSVTGTGTGTGSGTTTGTVTGSGTTTGTGTGSTPPRCQPKWTYYANDGTTIIKPDIAGCAAANDPKPWCPTNDGYVAGGKQNVTWKYTDDPSDPQCLKNWTYYSGAGIRLAGPIPTITKEGDTKNWCPIAGSYISGGKLGENWMYC